MNATFFTTLHSFHLVIFMSYDRERCTNPFRYILWYSTFASSIREQVIKYLQGKRSEDECRGECPRKSIFKLILYLNT